jgi:transposase InsO family protein
MPFQELSKMDIRRQMVLRLESGELSIAQASREYGVARNTVKLWLRRSAEVGVVDLVEHSRRPRGLRCPTAEEVEQELLAAKARKPFYGAKKLLNILWPEGAPISVRTGDRILKRHGMVSERRPSVVKAEGRFEREQPNELWQIDFKGLGLRPPGYSPLSVLDDATRFMLAFEPLPDHRSKTIFSALWDVFGTYGLPAAILSDNEPCFRDHHARGPSWFESQLWLLGIRTLHGRPRHPQTQGKVERFHGTVQAELGLELRQPSIQAAKERFKRYLLEYNYERPHEALNLKRPGQVYRPSSVSRPGLMPEHVIPEGAIARKVDAYGRFSYRCESYSTSQGLIGQYVVIREFESELCAFFADRKLGPLQEMCG